MFEDGVKRLRCCHLQAPDLFQKFSVHVFETETENVRQGNVWDMVNGTIFIHYHDLSLSNFFLRMSLRSRDQ